MKLRVIWWPVGEAIGGDTYWFSYKPTAVEEEEDEEEEDEA